VYDLVGNLHEWVADPVDYSLPRKIPLRPDIRAKIPKNLGKGIFMGGFYSTTRQHGSGCRFLTPGHGPRYHDYSTGFRCCADLRTDGST
jgi:formylglycine-generating enzyme required for sulfatase activity